MKSFRDPVTNVLRAWGHAESNGGDIARNEPENFNLEPGKWRLVGDTWQPYTVTPVPASVTMRQAREALIRRGLLGAVESHLTGMAGIEGEIARNEWAHSQVVERGRPLTLAMAQVLGMALPEELDELFVFAATL